jgi:hypothetical protein
MTFFIGMEHNKKGVFAEPGFSEVVKSKVAIQILTKKSLSNNLVSHFLVGRRRQVAIVDEYLDKMFSISQWTYKPNMTYTPIKYSGPVEDNLPTCSLSINKPTNMSYTPVRYSSPVEIILSKCSISIKVIN